MGLGGLGGRFLLTRLPRPRASDILCFGLQGFFGFIICMAGLLSITITSPVTHMFSSVRRLRRSISSVCWPAPLTLSAIVMLFYSLQAVRSVLQTVLGMAIFSDILTVCVLRSLPGSISCPHSPLTLAPCSAFWSRPRAISISLILIGSSAYAYVKATQGPPGSKPPPAAGETSEQELSRVENGKASLARTEQVNDDDDELVGVAPGGSAIKEAEKVTLLAGSSTDEKR